VPDGVDLGTGGVRVGLFDRQGTPAVFHAVEWETTYPRPGWAEQDPDDRRGRRHLGGRDRLYGGGE
jgi:glycerol kinase